MHSISRVEAAFWYGCTVLILLSAALYNGFPLVTSDTGTYINSGFHWEVPQDRPITYGVFVRLASFSFSLWLVIGAQCAVLSAVMLRSIKVLVSATSSPGVRVGLILLSVWATGVAWFSGQVMPDIFTGIGLLTLLLLYFDDELKAPARITLMVLLLVCTIMHSSNLITYSLTVLLVVGYAWAIKGRTVLLPLRKVLPIAAVVLSGWLALPGMHWVFGGSFTVSRSSYMFLMGRLVESGILDRYLAKNCADSNYMQLCKYRSELPNDAISFLWDAQSVPNRTGGWEAHRQEYEFIIRDILTSPRYYPALVSEAIQATFRQLVSVEHGDGLTAFRENTNPFWKVQEFFPYELREYLSSRQNTSRFDFSELNTRNQFVLLITVALLCLGLGSRVRKQLSEKERLWLLICISGIVANAGVTGGLANVLSRLQTRTVWVLPFSVFCLAFAHRADIRAYFKGSKKRTTLINNATSLK